MSGRLELSFAAALGAPAEDLCLHAQVWEATITIMMITIILQPS